MPDLYAAVPGGMPTGWLKKIGLLEKQVSELQRDIREIKVAMKKLEQPESALVGAIVPDGPMIIETGMPPVKRGPGRPRKNPQ